jgi:hypothetical protein
VGADSGTVGGSGTRCPTTIRAATRTGTWNPSHCPEVVLQAEVNRCVKKGLSRRVADERHRPTRQAKEIQLWWALIWTLVALVGLLVYPC